MTFFLLQTIGKSSKKPYRGKHFDKNYKIKDQEVAKTKEEKR